MTSTTFPSQEQVFDLLQTARTIAVVGMSDKPYRDSYSVAMYLKSNGYEILPVNPLLDQVDGIPVAQSLLRLTKHVDIVDVFRRSEAVPEIVEQAIEIGARAVWLQLGVHHDEAVRKAQAAGLMVIQDSCLKVVHATMMSRG